jgi:uracil-DNA glycosylase
MYVSNLVDAFRSGGADVDSVEALVHRGVYLTVAVKAPKLAASIPTATVEEQAPLLAAELDALANLRVVVLMGDVAIKAMNAVARQRRQRRVIPSGPTYRLRHGEYHYGAVRVLPSYLPTGRSYLIERSKREMLAEDLRLALGLMSAGARSLYSPRDLRGPGGSPCRIGASDARERKPAEHSRDDADHGEHRPRRLVPEAVPHLEADQRREREADRRRATKGAHVRAPDVRRGKIRHDRLRRRHPEHLPDHEDDHNEDDRP